MIPNELDTLRAAAKRDDRVAVMALVERLDMVFERDRHGSRRFDTMTALLDQWIDDSNDDAKNGYREAVVELEQRRIELDRSALAYVQGENPSTTFVESVDTVDEAYTVCQERTETLEAAVSSIQIPPLLTLWGDPAIEVPKGATIDAELSLTTAGRSHSDSIAIDVASEISANVFPSTVESLDETETVPVRVELSPSTAGEFDVFVTATGEANTDQFHITTLVLGKREYVDRASQLVGSLETMLGSVEGLRRRNGLRNQAQTLRRRLESISDDVEKRRRSASSIDNQLGAVRNSTEAMEREISSIEPSVERQKALYVLKNITERIGSAIEALS